VELVSNTKVRSDDILSETTVDGKIICIFFSYLFVYAVPDKPSQADVDAKIIVSSDDQILTSTQYPISIDQSLFSNENGNLINYLVYVRQGEEQFLFAIKVF
jgi:hypothetical protein